MNNLPTTLVSAAEQVAALGSCSAEIAVLTDDALMEAQKTVAALRRAADTYGALVAGEIAARSTFEHGYTGLAQREGFRTPEALIQSVTQGTKAEAIKLVQVGTMLAEASPAGESTGGESNGAPAPSPDATWRGHIAVAVSRGEISADSAAAIRRGLGVVDAAVTSAQLESATGILLGEAGSVNADELFHHARRLREQIDSAAIERREKQQYELRSLRSWWRSDGMREGRFVLTPEDGRLFEDIFSTILSPRRGGPRFTSPEAIAAAEKLQNDPRTNEQISVDSLMGMLKTALDSDFGVVPGARRPAVRVIVTHDDVTAVHDDGTAVHDGGETEEFSRDKGGGRASSGRAPTHGGAVRLANVSPVDVMSGAAGGHSDDSPPPGQTVLQPIIVDPIEAAAAAATEPPGCSCLGHGELEGHPDPISLNLVRRAICDTGMIRLTLGSKGEVLDLGRTQRLHSPAQRQAIAVISGGCIYPGCDTAPCMCEVHHIIWWSDGGTTSVSDGVLVCRHHHLLIHNNDWGITRIDATYWLIPPAKVDPTRTPIRLHSKTGLVRELEQRRDNLKTAQLARETEAAALRKELEAERGAELEAERGAELEAERGADLEAGRDARGENRA